MSKYRKIEENDKIINKSFPFTPKASKENFFPSTDIRKKNQYLAKLNFNSNSIIENIEESVNMNSEIKKSPKDILSSLLRQSLGKSLLKLESSSKEQNNNLKFIYKNFLIFDKTIKLLKVGIENKKKEEAKKLNHSKKLKSNKINNKYNSKTPLRIRSKTFQKLRNPLRDNNKNHYNNTKTNIIRKKSYLYSDTFNRRNEKENNKKETSKIRAKSNTRPSNYKEREPRTYKRNKRNNIEKTPKREYTNYKTPKRLSGVSSKNNVITDENKNNLKNKYNTTNTNSSRKSRSKHKKNSMKINEKIIERKKSIKSIKNGERSIKRKMSTKKKLKIDGEIKLKKSLILNNQENIETPILTNIEKTISNFNFNDINIINNNINILTNENLPKDINNINENNDASLKTDENININEIIKEKAEKQNNKEENKYKNIKDLEEFEGKKYRFDEEEKERRIRKRMRSYSKNRTKKNFDSISIDKDFEGSLKDVKLMIEGVSGVLNQIKIKSDKKSRFKKKFKENSLKKQLSDEDNNKENKDIIKEDKKNENDKNKFLNDLDKEIMELIEFEEKRKKIEKENQNEKDKLDINIHNSFKKKEKEKNTNMNFIESQKEKNDLLNLEIKEDKKIKLKENQGINKISKRKIKKRKTINNFTLIRNLKFENEQKIMNEELINKINKEENILSKSLNEININLEEQNKEEDNDKVDDNKLEDDKNINFNNNNHYEIIEEKEINEDNDNNTNKNIYLDNIEKQLIEKTKLYYYEQSDIIQNESRIMRDEQLVDLNNQSLNHSSLVNQSSLINQSLLDQYIIITKEPNLPFSIENTLKYDKITCLGILDYLNFKEKIEFTGINRAFNLERISLLNYERENYIHSLELGSKETVDDLIMKIRLKYSKEELTKPFNEFQIPKGPYKAVELLNNDLYCKIFKKDIIEKNEEEICIIYRALLILLGEFEIASIFNDKKFWKKCIEYLSENSNGKIGTFILEKFKNISFSHKKIFLLNKLLIGIKNKILPTYFSKICGTTGLLTFLIKDALEYCGVIINTRKTQPSRVLDNLMYYKNVIDTLALFIDYLSGIKTYRIKDKKTNK